VEIVNALWRREAPDLDGITNVTLKQLPVVAVGGLYCLIISSMARGIALGDGSCCNAPEETIVSIYAKQLETYKSLVSRWQSS
jgi:hypothetical protein